MKQLMGLLGSGFASALRWLPPTVLRRLGYAFGHLWFDIFRIRRWVILNNFKIAFPEWGDSERLSAARRSMEHMGHNLMEYAYLQNLSQEEWDRFFVAEGFENLERALQQGKGGLLLTLHLGNYDLALAGLALHGFPISLVSKEFRIRWLNDLWFGMRARCGIRFIPPRNSSYAVLKGLKRGEVVVFVLDQFTGPPIGIKNTFFGHPTGTGLGLALMAERSRAPVIPAYTFRQEDGRHRIVVEPPIPFEDKGDRDQSLAHMTQVYTDRLEAYVRRYPEQWMWLHKRWKTFKF